MTDVISTDAIAPAHPTIRREDYRPPEWLVPQVRLDFDLSLNATEVAAQLEVTRNGAHSEPLRLDVDGTWPERLTVDGTPVEVARGADHVLVPIAGDHATVAFTTRLDPSANTQLMGLYASNGLLCTQCEAEGFRRIIPFPDRPDVLSVYTVRMVANRVDFPVLLSNGEERAAGELEGGRHFAEWHDPWPKPSYLFALVAGDLVANRDRFTTMSGREVALGIWVRDGDLDRTHHAMAALKASMRWDEEKYGREYDLDRFNIVAVADFNAGAMENKGLNIFNSRYILADSDTATDLDFDGVERVVAHEYFHNWSGNRVTCRDWFQLSLKEGFTVYRDQVFSGDMGSHAVERIGQVRMLRAAQFPEDAGPLAHPIRPESYQEIGNFYTATVYNKGAEVIRMMETIVGPDRYRAGTDLYFDRHDGEAATCEDFVRSMEDGAEADLTQFRRWYEQAGTPKVTALVEHDAASGNAVLHLTQSVPPTPGQPVKAPMVLPLAVAAHDAQGNSLGEERLVLLTQQQDSVDLGRFATRPMLSFNRRFSAPIIADVERAEGELDWLAAHDDDPFARYEALQALMLRALVAGSNGAPDAAANDAVVTAVGNLIARWEEDPAFIAEAATLPAEAFVGDQLERVDPDAIRATRRALQRRLGEAHAAQWSAILTGSASDPGDLSPSAKGRRKLAGLALMMLWAGGSEGIEARALELYRGARGMTDRMAALAVLAHGEGAERDTALADFYERYRGDALVLDKWFSTQALSLRADVPEQVEALGRHADFTLTNPNRVRSLYGALSVNQWAFHRADGMGYRLLADLIIALDPVNASTAAKMVPPFGRWKRFDEARAALMRAELERILATPGLSRDVAEQASKSLAG